MKPSRALVRLVLSACVATLSFIGAATPLSASPITYTLTGLFNGSLNGVAFSGTSGTFQLTADTSAVTTSDNLFFFNTGGISTFQLGSETPVTFLSSTFGVESEFGAATFMDSAQGFATGEFNYDTPYDILSSAATAAGDFASYGPVSAATSGGNLILTGAVGDVTFQSAAVAATTATPEPSTLWLTATGLLSAAAGLRRKILA